MTYRPYFFPAWKRKQIIIFILGHNVFQVLLLWKLECQLLRQKIYALPVTRPTDFMLRHQDFKYGMPTILDLTNTVSTKHS